MRSPTRKTIAVVDVKNRINGMLARPLEHVERDSKVTLCCLIEDILMNTGNYRGFQFANPSTEVGDDDYYNRTYI